MEDERPTKRMEEGWPQKWGGQGGGVEATEEHCPVPAVEPRAGFAGDPPSEQGESG